MKPLGYPSKESHLTRCGIIGRKRLCIECIHEAKILKKGRMKQKRYDRKEIIQQMNEKDILCNIES